MLAGIQLRTSSTKLLFTHAFCLLVTAFMLQLWWLTILRSSTQGLGATAAPCTLAFRVLSMIAEGGSGTTYLCYAMGVQQQQASQQLVPIGRVVIKVGAAAELSKGVPVAYSEVFRQLWADWWGAHLGQGQEHVAQACGIGLFAAAMEYNREETRLRAEQQAEASTTAAAERARAELDRCTAGLGMATAQAGRLS
jgi:hypothetical protein